uniref:Uncharacterized protein n=1 Tax=Arion vulgaris TaxID=1028688 RepID=A0A0B6YWZ5_9EUPU
MKCNRLQLMQRNHSALNPRQAILLYYYDEITGNHRDKSVHGLEKEEKQMNMLHKCKHILKQNYRLTNTAREVPNKYK